MERKNPSDRLVMEQKDIIKLIRKEHKIHINPNKKTVFIKVDQLETGYLSYLKEKHNLPIDTTTLIPMEKQQKKKASKPTIKIPKNIPIPKKHLLSTQQVNPSIPKISYPSKTSNTFIDDTFEISPTILLQSLAPFFSNNY